MNTRRIERQSRPIEPTPVSGDDRETPRPSERAHAPKVDMYGAPHKTLRFLLAKLLLKTGTTTFTNPSEAVAVCEELELALWLCDRHIEHEDAHVRPALAARAPNAVEILDAEHLEHAAHAAELRSLAAALRGATTDVGRRTLGHTLYLHFSVFVAETLAHAAYEERVVQPLLDRLFSTEELTKIHDVLVASIPQAEMLAWMRAMIPASNREERAEMLANVKANAPADDFQGLMDELRPLLSDEDGADLRRRLFS